MVRKRIARLTPDWKHLARGAAQAVARIGIARTSLRWVAARGFVPERLWRAMPVEGVFSVRIGRGERFVYEGSKQDYVGTSLYWAGISAFEAETFPTFINLARDARVFLDIGACTGVYTLVGSAVNPNLATYAFEPVPQLYERLRRHVALNGLEARCRTIGKAVSDREGRETLFVPESDFPDTSHLADVGPPDARPGTCVEVEVTTVPRSIPAEQAVDLVKIDVEGAEGPVIEGMRELLAKQRPTLIVEFLPWGSGDHAQAVLDHLGYRYFHLTDRGPIPVESVTPRSHSPHRNYLCAPSPAVAGSAPLLRETARPSRVG